LIIKTGKVWKKKINCKLLISLAYSYNLKKKYLPVLAVLYWPCWNGLTFQPLGSRRIIPSDPMKGFDMPRKQKRLRDAEKLAKRELKATRLAIDEMAKHGKPVTSQIFFVKERPRRPDGKKKRIDPLFSPLKQAQVRGAMISKRKGPIIKKDWF
jgi:hypothetical protein